MSLSTPRLFQPIVVGQMHLKNRVVLAPLTRLRANKQHIPNLPVMQEYYSQRGSTPGTFLISEATSIALRAGGSKHIPGIYNQEQISAWKAIVDGVHTVNSYIYCQLWAIGRQASEESLKEDDPSLSVVGPSPIPISQKSPVPRELTLSEIREYVQLYAAAARNAVHKAHFDGVEIHGANGYLIDEFLQDVSNQRQDEYGGSIERRARFGLEVVQAVVDAVGTPTKVGIRLSPWSSFGGMGMDDPVPQFTYFVTRLKEDFPDLAYIHVIEPRVAGDRDHNVRAEKPHASNDFLRDMWAPRPFISAGGYTRQDAVKQADERENELVAFGRTFIANPDLPVRLEKDIPLNPYERKTFYLLGDTTGKASALSAGGSRGTDIDACIRSPRPFNSYSGPMPLFSCAQRLDITGGTYIDNSVQHNVANYFLVKQSGIELLLQAAEPGAAFDSAARTTAPRCHPGTREEFIGTIFQWVTVRNGDPPLSWMKGPAGVGKSAVIQTCVERLRDASALCAAFFFSINGRKDSMRLFPSIAYQLSLLIPSYYDLLDERIRFDKTLLNKSLRGQFQGLILEPLRELMARSGNLTRRIPVFIDGLDECESKEDQCDIIEIVAEAAQLMTLPISWVFSTRPEVHIVTTFSKTTIASLTLKIDLPISREDDAEIETFLRHGLDLVLKRHNMPMNYCWPSEKEVQMLVDASDGLFSYGSAALRFIGDPKWSDPQEPLDLILQSITHDANNSLMGNAAPPFGELDALYYMIMENMPPGRHPLAGLVLTLLSLTSKSSNTLGAMLHRRILGLSEFQFRSICGDLSAVLLIEDHPPLDLATHIEPILESVMDIYHFSRFHYGGSVRFYHKSFIDFLVDPRRSGKYCTAVPSAYVALFKHFLNVYPTYDFDHGKISSYLELATGDSRNAHCPRTETCIREHVNPLFPLFVLEQLHELWMEIAPEIPASDSEALYGRFSGWNFRSIYRIRQCVLGGTAWLSFFQWKCKVEVKWIGIAELVTIQNPEFAKFDLIGFRKMVENQLRGGLLRELSCVTLCPQLLKESYESALFRIGHGNRSIFWYCEISFEEKIYREFWAPDIAAGVEALL
ncbi:hypothetical protein NP233_g693 [Leucocoprinus birnbaumii]|uniref:N-ethylmaleimide reductase n=1 Tax=Leucocoprinus birnbaumii TaxID=56174 RepID=A0AAD5YWI4_9AGAR|nr:hypothetical protein NP233_g693 [Leucocoprinus birnbaumii]